MQRMHLPRQGPRPLALHLAVVLSTLLSSSAGLPILRSGWLPWRPALRDRATALARDVRKSDPVGLHGAVDREMRRRIDAFLTGIERYRHHPYRRRLADPPVLWADSDSRLLDYGALTGTRGRTVLFVPSLINRAYILDLSERCSLLRWLAGEGLRPVLLDWGKPGPLERGYSLTDYIAGRLERALERLVQLRGGPVAVVGYCMGGLLAAALAQRRPRDISHFVALATPWDFGTAETAQARAGAGLMLPYGPALDRWGEMPVDLLQALFAAVDPWQIARKFMQFARMAPDSERAHAFVALEDWLNDGVPLAAPVARDAFFGWYGENTPARGVWRIAGQPVTPAAIPARALVVVPSQDRIVPPESALALGRALPSAAIWTPAIGHIGMIVGGRAPEQVWGPLAAWLRSP